VATKEPKREAHFPAIEKRYGEKMAYWFKVMEKVKEKKYPEQMALLQEDYGFSRAHANALVMYTRGSLSSSRRESPTDYYKSIDPVQAKTIRRIFKIIKDKYPTLEFVMAWNQPMVRIDKFYVFGAGVSKNHILLNPFSKDALDAVMPQFSGFMTNKHTIKVPNDWDVEEKMVLRLIKARLSEK
jgi:uncharacterized protein